MTFKNKIVLITGASSGIGNALAKKLAEENARLILLSRNFEKLQELKNEFPNSEIDIYKCDVTNKANVIEVFSEIKEKLNSVDLSILNSAVSYRMKIEEFDSSLAEKIFNTNVLGIIYCLEQLLPMYLKSKKGIIAGVSSLADSRGYSGSGFYCASKSAVTTYLEGLSVDLKRFGIKVITIKPGFVKTPMTDKNEFKMPFLMDTEKAAKIIMNGLKKEKRFIQFPFPILVGYKIVGLLPDKFYEFLSSKFGMIK